jgi:hypothetical protein
MIKELLREICGICEPPSQICDATMLNQLTKEILQLYYLLY